MEIIRSSRPCFLNPRLSLSDVGASPALTPLVFFHCSRANAFSAMVNSTPFPLSLSTRLLVRSLLPPVVSVPRHTRRFCSRLGIHIFTECSRADFEFCIRGFGHACPMPCCAPDGIQSLVFCCYLRNGPLQTPPCNPFVLSRATTSCRSFIEKPAAKILISEPPVQFRKKLTPFKKKFFVAGFPPLTLLLLSLPS